MVGAKPCGWCWPACAICRMANVNTGRRQGTKVVSGEARLFFAGQQRHESEAGTGEHCVCLCSPQRYLFCLHLLQGKGPQQAADADVL